MIARLWKGWATEENARAYEELFRTFILPELQGIDGFADAYVLRRETGREVEILTVTLFSSMEAIRAFAGADPGIAHVTPQAQQLLSRFEKTVIHFDVALNSGQN